MPRVDASNVEVLVYTFKEGLLSAVAHDLKIRVERCSVEVEPERIVATFDTRSLKVVTAMKDGAPSSALLSPMKAEIEKNIVADVLDAARFPEARFETTAIGPTEVEGDLVLKGVKRHLRAAWRQDGATRVAEFTLDQRDFGIKPYSAMLGTLKIKPEVKVSVRLTA
ncbi:MAG: YceI family protein [Myxococcaceae bacterium]|nr:YceI family protein [Myxococcaceae bacterium]